MLLVAAICVDADRKQVVDIASYGSKGPHGPALVNQWSIGGWNGPALNVDGRDAWDNGNGIAVGVDGHDG